MQLRAAREMSGKTQAQVAKEVGVAERTYQYYESAEKEPSAGKRNRSVVRGGNPGNS